jgi:hypothetical protein
MLSEKDLARITEALAGRVPPLVLRFQPDPGPSELGAALKGIAEAVAAAAAEGALLREDESAELPAHPALTFTAPGRGGIHYLALPEGRETLPFVDALVAEGPASMDADLVERLRALEKPVELHVFMASECPHCPNAVRAATALALASERISTFIIDAQRFAELAARFKVATVPRTIIDGGLCLIGVKPVRELAEIVLSAGTPDYRQRHLLSLLETRRMEEAIDLVCAPGGDEAFLALWQKSTTTSRMALLLAEEKALERSPRSLDGIVPDLADLLGSDDATLRGDTVDLLGKIGHPDAAPAIKALLSDPNPDVAEIAAEVLQELQG